MKHIQRSFASDFSRTARAGGDLILEEIAETPEQVLECRHFEYCNTRRFGHINCLTKSSIENCSSWKYYNKYGEQGNYLGI